MMTNDAQSSKIGRVGRGGGGRSGILSRTLSSYLRIVSSGASTVASTVRSAGASVASSIANWDDDAGFDQVHWAGFDKLECDGDIVRQVLLLGYRSGFQVWDVEEEDDVRQLVARHDCAVSFLQMQKKPIASKGREDQFADVRPLLVVAVDGSFPCSSDDPDCFASPCNGTADNYQGLDKENLIHTSVRFYSLKTHDYVHVLKFRSPVYSIRCSARVVAVCQAAQIHCFDAATLEKDYTVLTCPYDGSGDIGCPPLALGSRWLAYSGSPVRVSSTGRVSSQHLNPPTNSLSSMNGRLVTHYAKESSKKLAAGIVTLGDIGCKKLSKYCAEFIPENYSSMKHCNSSLKAKGTINGQCLDTENAGMVIVRDIVSKLVVVQFRAHKSPISALVFGPSGSLLVTASVYGHNINVFQIMPSHRGSSSASDATGSCIHLFRLQRGLTNAVIQDISFSIDTRWIMISSARGTSHLFSIPPSGGTGDEQFNDVNHANGNYGSNPDASNLNQEAFLPTGSPLTLASISRIRNGNGWKGAVNGAAAAATGRVTPLSGAIASVFHNSNRSILYQNNNTLRTGYYFLVFSPSGSIIQYVLRHLSFEDSISDHAGLSAVSHESSPVTDSVLVEALKKWDVCGKNDRWDGVDNIDVYGDRGNGESTKFFQKGIKKGTCIYPKVKHNADEDHHTYISEVELQMYSSQVSLWAKNKVHFQVMMDEYFLEGNDSALGGEVEIEKLPTRIIEARTKGLIPVFDYPRT